MTYDRSAPWYDKIYSFKDYAAEAARLRTLVEQRRPGTRRLLDVACGRGNTSATCASTSTWWASTPARRCWRSPAGSSPGVPLHRGDMRTFDLGTTFDAAICMFGAMGHLQDEGEVRAAIRQIANHVLPGGVLIVEPWLTPEAFVPGKVSGLFVDEPELKIARMSVGRRQGRLGIPRDAPFDRLAGGSGAFRRELDMTLFPTRRTARPWPPSARRSSSIRRGRWAVVCLWECCLRTEGGCEARATAMATSDFTVKTNRVSLRNPVCLVSVDPVCRLSPSGGWVGMLAEGCNSPSRPPPPCSSRRRWEALPPPPPIP